MGKGCKIPFKSRPKGSHADRIWGEKRVGRGPRRVGLRNLTLETPSRKI